MRKRKLMDGVARNKKYPDTFQIPSDADIAGLRPGDFFKVGVDGIKRDDCSGERFWVKFTAQGNGVIFGVVEQIDMLFGEDHGYRHGDKISCQPKHILGVMDHSGGDVERQERGVKAIIALQKMQGITETEEKATAGWNSMSKHEQDFTLHFYDSIKEEKC